MQAISAIRQFVSAFPTAAFVGWKGSNKFFFNLIQWLVLLPHHSEISMPMPALFFLTSPQCSFSQAETLMTWGRVVLGDASVCLSSLILICSWGQPIIILHRSWQRTSYRKSSHTSQFTLSVWQASQCSRVHTIIGWLHSLLSLPYWNLTMLLPCRYLPCWHLTTTLAFTTNFHQLIPQAVAETCCTLAASAPAIGNSSSSWNTFCPSSDSKVNTSLLFSYHIPFTVFTYSLQ